MSLSFMSTKTLVDGLDVLLGSLGSLGNDKFTCTPTKLDTYMSIIHVIGQSVRQKMIVMPSGTMFWLKAKTSS